MEVVVKIMYLLCLVKVVKRTPEESANQEDEITQLTNQNSKQHVVCRKHGKT